MTHVDDMIWDWLLGALDDEDARAVDEHLAVCEACRQRLDEQTRLLAAIAPAPAPPREGLLNRATTLARFDQWSGIIASMADVAMEKARGWLAKIDDPAVWSPTALGDLELFHIEGGPAVERAVVGFVKLAPGTSFPEHTHLGTERVFVLQGRLRDEHGDIHGPGSLVEGDEGHTHEISAEPGPPLVYLSIVHEGIEIFGMRFGPDSPEL